MTYRMLKLFSWLVRNAPAGCQRLIGNFIGGLTWLLVPEKRKVMAVDNIVRSLGLPKAEAMQAAKQSWTRFGHMIVEVMCFPNLKRDISAKISFEGREYIDEALSYGRGVVLVTAHSGNWELLGGALATSGYPLVAVAQRQANGDMDKLINEYRELVGQHVTYKNGVRDMVRMLSKGSIIGLLMDQDSSPNGIRLNFFGRPAYAAEGPAFLARINNAPLLPVFITETEYGKHKIIVHPPFFIEKTDDKQADLEVTTVKLTKIIEDHIRQYPNDWFWMHNRWKNGEKIYKKK